MSKFNPLLACSILIALVVAFGALKAEDTPAPGDTPATPGETEAQQAAREEENEKKLDELGQINLIKTVTGKLAVSGDPGADGGDVVGTLTDSTKVYMLKLEKPELMQVLKPYNGKTISLKGKLRNQGKYLMVTAVTEPAASGAAPDRVKRGGI